ncbi:MULTISPECIES: citrate lyase subunit alpha [Roseobacteraceae]|uniref:Citrate lyase alpha chain n=1 Tax=Pseudosulfitobacter pseudonitzschiae TaxID=1402135 RepID=A0A221K4K5_9RHOB|nr:MULTISPECIES: citrate lyase subunit alpha [Roseobacteraceae]ASM73803.1 citrate lyase alpha chain [Pseudosulfitobacter pseudonitzschiae]
MKSWSAADHDPRRPSPHAKGGALMSVSLQDAIATSGLRSGGTLSFHHHLRNGDAVLNATLQACAALGLRDLHIAPSSVFPCHAPLVDHIRTGTVTRITTAYMSGPVAEAISGGVLAQTVTLQTHGGRARRISNGTLPIDLAVIAAPSVDDDGNIGGADGVNACGPLGYAMVDAAHARHVIAVTDEPCGPLRRVCIPAGDIQVVRVVSIGDAAYLTSGTTARAPGAEAQAIADRTLALIAASGLLQDGFAFQAGAGATSLATARQVARLMGDTGVKGAFIAGGITAAAVEMQRAGLFGKLLNVQSFDRAAVADYAVNPDHIAMSAAEYASPDHPDTVADRLDVMLLGAAEVDVNFNVNVTTTGQGRIIGGSGGHADTAAGAKLAIVTMPLRARETPRVVAQVRCLTTPGTSIDAVVTEAGVAINPERADLSERLRHSGVEVIGIEDLQSMAGPSLPTNASGRVVAKVEHRNGSILDRVRATSD